MIPVSLEEKRAVQKEMWEHAMPYFATWDPLSEMEAFVEQRMVLLLLAYSQWTLIPRTA